MPKKGPKPIYGETMKVLPVRVTPDQAQRLREQAIKSGTTVSNVVRQILIREDNIPAQKGKSDG